MTSPTDTLVERVAAAIAKADGWDPIDEVSEHWREYRGVARAAIRVVLHECDGLLEERAREETPTKALLLRKAALRISALLPKDTP